MCPLSRISDVRRASAVCVFCLTVACSRLFCVTFADRQEYYSSDTAMSKFGEDSSTSQKHQAISPIYDALLKQFPNTVCLPPLTTSPNPFRSAGPSSDSIHQPFPHRSMSGTPKLLHDFRSLWPSYYFFSFRCPTPHRNILDRIK